MAILGTNDIGDGQLAISIDHDPTVTATDATKGSLLIRTDVSPPVLYIKTDDGSTTNVNTMGQVGVLTHADLLSVTANQHHNQSHGNVDHTTGVAPADVTKAAAAEGTNAAVARADHKHDISTTTPGTTAVGDAATEGTATSLTRSDHKHAVTAPAAPADVTKAAAAAGASANVARQDHKHDASTASAGASSDIGDAAAEGSATSLARSDHQHAFPAPTAGYPVDTDFSAEADGTATTPARSDHRHNIPAPAAPADVTKAAAAAGTATSPSRADHKHDVSTAAASASVDVGDASAEGTATSLSRSDHQHAVTAPAAPADVTKAAAAAGSSTNVARQDHKHDVSTAAASASVDIGDASAEGTATSLTRSDHQHAVPAPSAPTTSAVGDAAAAGSATAPARGDHTHGRESFGAVTAVSWADASANGSATTDARSDHNHGLPESGHRKPARVATTANITLSGAQTIDGVSAIAGDRVLVKNQTTGSENGIYVVAAGAWSRATDFDTSAEVTCGIGIPVCEGTAAADTLWMLTTNNPITLGTTALTFAQIAPSAVSFATPAIVLGTAAAAGAASTAIRSDSTIVAFDVTTPTTSAVGDAAATGAAAVASRRDHVHGREAFGTPGSSAVGDTVSAGVATTETRSDHRHGRESFATPSIVLGTAAAAGAATTPIRSDSTIAAFDATTPTTSAVGDAAATGAVAFAARRDHVHGREAFGAVTAVSFADAAANGSATTDARSDHNHGLPEPGHRKACRVATTANITLSAAQTIDGVSAVAGDRVLVKNQTTGSQNGIYVVAAGAWTRSTDFDTNAEVTSGICVPVSEGTVGADTVWLLSTNDPITVGTTSLTFVVVATQFGTPAIVLGTAVAAGTANTAVRTDATLLAFDATVPTTTTVGGAAAVGSATVAARRDHAHAMTAPAAPANVDGAAAAAGSATNAAREDHKHNVNFATPVAVGNANAAGSATTLPRSDHVHAGLPIYLLYADQLDNPVTANWAVNALAPATADSTNSALVVRRFDDTAEEGAGFILTVPSWATSITITYKSRAQTAPAGVRTVGVKLYYRSIPDNAAIAAWSSLVLTDISIPTNATFQYDTQTVALSTFSPAISAGGLYQFELTRINPTAGTELVGDWDLVELGIQFT